MGFYIGYLPERKTPVVMGMAKEKTQRHMRGYFRKGSFD
jgi:hypothetical protein